ncbi:hypothetical protein SAMN04488693_10810 [Arthrobacter subterraneus]|uniref:Hpt domain-containing protein n=1 Tax=Arthrobacter subterraneus TaxID=335973 RepID=A0A1G8J2W2_9MICC|nr:Hpt domain-containing protein [Arthrobacter subterraneus]SDI25536.1 hypothetical protein SAMN04488693_10810 [Arthrobacter subterraneus]
MATKKRIPLVDHHVLHDLEDDLQDPMSARDFARDFVRAWDDKYHRLETAVCVHDQPAALDAVLSVKITAVMVGAPRLAKSAIELERRIRKGDMRSSEEALENIHTCGDETMQELMTTYLNRET